MLFKSENCTNMYISRTHPIFYLLCAVIALLVPTATYAERVELANGDIYEGELVDGLRTGSGTYVWQNGNRYEGEFSNNRLHGKGTYTWTDGRSYSGEFQNDKRHGRGTFNWPNKDVYEGQFVDGQRTGKGKFVWFGQAQYEGDFVDGELTGLGQYKWQDGRSYTGAFQKGLKHGVGEFQWPNGNRYIGEFHDDLRNGRGLFLWRDGTVYTGNFAENKMHGWGVKSQAEAERVLQFWQQGTLEVNLAIHSFANCTLNYLETSWMFESPHCINGLAHGNGVAVTLDGQAVIENGVFILGRKVAGELIQLPSYDPEHNIIQPGQEIRLEFQSLPES